MRHTDKKLRMEKNSDPELSAEEIREGMLKGVEKYKKLNFFEKFAMYMGVSQLLEIGLKNLLVEKYESDHEKLERWSLGTVAKELEKKGLRKDFMILLNSVVYYRNYIAHNMLANKALIHGIIGQVPNENHYDKDQRLLDKAILELEQLIFLFDWTNEHDGWD